MKTHNPNCQALEYRVLIRKRFKDGSVLADCNCNCGFTIRVLIKSVRGNEEFIVIPEE